MHPPPKERITQRKRNSFFWVAGGCVGSRGGGGVDTGFMGQERGQSGVGGVDTRWGQERGQREGFMGQERGQSGVKEGVLTRVSWVRVGPWVKRGIMGQEGVGVLTHRFGRGCSHESLNGHWSYSVASTSSVPALSVVPRSYSPLRKIKIRTRVR